MARRSARLQKATPPVEKPTRESDSSWQTASSPPPELPSLPELPEPDLKTPKKVAAEERKPVSKLPQAKPTPLNKKTSQAQITQSVTKTPSDDTPIVPESREMHPVHHHATTAGEYDEARWLGFQSIAPHTALRKGTVRLPSTPTKTPQPTRGAQNEMSPEFSFRIKSPFSMLKGPSNLSPRTRNILDAAPMGGTPGAGARAIFTTNEFSTKADMIPDRKKAAPKGKMARFSDVHIAEFKKMDSIANHPSAFRADPNRFKPVIGQSLKKSPSRPEVTKPKPEPNKLKRTQSKMDVAESSSKNTGSLKRTQSKMDMTENVARIPPSVTLKRTQSKMDLQGSGLPRSASTIRLVATAGEDRPVSRDGPLDQGAKRVKRTESDDAGTSRPVSRHGLPAPTSTPARKITSQTALPRLAARLMTPTKASLARATQSAKPVKSTSMIPSFTKTPTKKSLFSPTNLARNLRDRAEEGMRQASQNLSRVRSILRTPSRKFSDDPAKVAAGTHMSPPPVPNYQKALPVAPATAPVKKHVNFTNSTLERAGENFGTPSPMKFRAGSVTPAGAVVYPALQPDVEYPELPVEVSKNVTSPSRRLTFGDKSMDRSNEFNFESGKFVNFGPASAGTIRMVRKSDASTLVGDKKRKLTTLQETSDKENDEPAEDEGRSSKRVKPTPAEPPKTPGGTSKLPRRTPGRGGSAISKSRLNFLATPKRTRV